MFKPDAIQTAAWRVLHLMLPDIELLHANQGDTQLTNYATLSMSSRTRAGQDVRAAVLADGTQVYRGQRGGSLTVIITSDDCNTLAEECVNRLQMDSASLAFRQHGITLFNATPIAFDPVEVEGGQYIQQAALDIQWRAQVEYSEQVGLIETVQAKYEVKNAGNEEIARGSFTVHLPDR